MDSLVTTKRNGLKITVMKYNFIILFYIGKADICISELKILSHYVENN